MGLQRVRHDWVTELNWYPDLAKQTLIRPKRVGLLPVYLVVSHKKAQEIHWHEHILNILKAKFTTAGIQTKITTHANKQENASCNEKKTQLKLIQNGMDQLLDKKQDNNLQKSNWFL